MVDSFVTADGCDSVVTTDVIIDPTRYGVDVKAICNSYTWVDGQTYTASTNSPLPILRPMVVIVLLLSI